MTIAQKVQSNGLKLTKSRAQICSWIDEHEGVFSAKEIMTALPKLDKVSVYRTLDMLESLDAIHPTLTHHGEKHYEVHGEEHHHHVVCTGCEKASCVDCEVTRTKAKGFTQLHHSVVYTGLCMTCSPT